MVDVKQATLNAQKYFKDFFPDAQGLRLEEVEFDNTSQQWWITLSFKDTSAPVGLGIYIRNYKLFKIDAQSGEVLAMKIRQIKNE